MSRWFSKMKGDSSLCADAQTMDTFTLIFDYFSLHTSQGLILLHQLLSFEQDRVGIKTLEWDLFTESTTSFSVGSPIKSVLLVVG
jgi:hypothetical protein